MTEDEFFNPPEPPDFSPSNLEPDPPARPIPTPTPVLSLQSQAVALNLSPTETETARQVVEALGVRQDDGLVPLVLLISKATGAYASVPAAVATATEKATETAIATLQKVSALESGAAAQKTANEIKKLIRAGAPSSLYKMWQTWAPLSLLLIGIIIGYFVGNAS